MLPIPELSKKHFQEIFEESKKKIPALTKEWTDFNYHDPGITILQLFAWLFEMQNFYADAIGDEHEYKYLKLLGYHPKNEQAARGMVTFSGAERTLRLPKGMKLSAGDIVYETEETETVLRNSIKRILKGEAFTDITAKLASPDGSYETLFSKNEKSCFYLGFSEVLNLNETLKIYFKVYEGYIKRPKFSADEPRMGKWLWEAYTIEGWKAVTVVMDETADFLKHGYIYLKASLETIPLSLNQQTESLHYLRCTLLFNEYDLCPKIDSVCMNTFKVIQQDTQVTSSLFSGTGEEEQSFRLDHYLALMGELIVTVKTASDEWQTFVTDNGTKAYRIEQQDDLTKQIVFSLSMYGMVPEKGKENIRIICYKKGFYDKCEIGPFKGYSHQQFQLDFNDIYYEKLNLDAVKAEGNTQIYKEYKQTDNMDAFGSEEFIYSVTEEDTLVFGDKHHGAVPSERGVRALVTSLAFTKGAAGNVKEHKIKNFCLEDSEVLRGVLAANQEATSQGADRQTKEEAIEAFRKQFTKENRAVTTKDYETIVRETPGLLIHKVKAISEKLLRPDAAYSNKVCIIVKPCSDEERPLISKTYKQAIKRHLEKYRLLTVEIDVLSPLYLPIDVYGCLYKKEGCDESKIYTCIKNAVDSVNGQRGFGEPIIFGSLFGQLDSMEGIAYIDYFTLTPAGPAGEHNLAGDITVAPNVLTYLRNYHVELR